MKRSYRFAIVAVCFLCCNAFATLDSERNVYKTKYTPYNQEESVAFVARDSSSIDYTPDTRCGQASDFTVTGLRMKYQYYWQSKKEVSGSWLGSFIEDDHYHCFFYIAEVTYEVKCENGLHYEGKDYLLSDTKKLNEGNPYENYDGVEKRAYDWRKLPLKSLQPDGTILDENGNRYDYPVEKLDWNKKQEILNRWTRQAVLYPPYHHLGTPGRMPTPVLLIHGLEDDFRVWGVKPKSDGGKGDSLFQTALVREYGYKSGSFPDILARSQNLSLKKDDINHNGIYFYQAPGKKIKGIWKEAYPHWDSISFSQSRYLYNKLIEVLDDYYSKDSVDWRKSNEYKIDLVAHSQGGLVIREMLRGLQKDKGTFGTDASNPANHIRKIITVDSPHFGSMLAATNMDAIKRRFPGLVHIINDLDSPTPVNHTLMKKTEVTTLKERMWEGMKMGGSPFIDACKMNCKDPLDFILMGWLSLLGAGAGSIVGALTDVTVEITGSYLGPYYITTRKDYPIGSDTHTDPVNTAGVIDYFKTVRANGRHLAGDGNFIQTLSKGSAFDVYPRLPNGTKPILLPMYSDNVSSLLSDILGQLSEGTNKICASQSSKDEGCFAAGDLFKAYAEASRGYAVTGNPLFSDTLWTVLKSLQDNWLSKSDLVVEGESQKFEKNEIALNHNNSQFEGHFQAPRNYVLHDARAYWEAVAHGNIPTVKESIPELNTTVTLSAASAPEQSFDLLCALYDNGCGEHINKMGMGAVLHLSEANFQPAPSQPASRLARSAAVNATSAYEARSIDMNGNFSIAPIFISNGVQGVAAQLGSKQSVVATYEPGIGSVVKWTGQDGTEHSEIVVAGKVATQPSISRNGNEITISFVNYSGKVFSKTLEFSDIPEQASVYVLSEKGSAMSLLAAGTGTATNPETQKPPPPPPGHRLAPVTLAVLHREARGEYESNTSRPRFLVFNATEDTLEFAKVAYYFTADPARVPKVTIDYPYIPVSVENLGGDKWRFVLDAGNQKLAPGTFYPSADGWQIRIHYSDWYEYKHLEDWSADYNRGEVKANRKIVVYNKNGKIIWGNEAPGFESEDNGIIPTPKGTIAWKDDAPWEKNSFKPRVTVKNTGSVALSDYHAQLWFRVPQGRILSIPSPDDWYTPESQASAKNVGGSVWILDMHFDKHILYSGDSVSEGNIGLHLTDWSDFDKTVCGIVLKDKEGNILFGKEPSIAECENYNGPNLLMPLYSRR